MTNSETTPEAPRTSSQRSRGFVLGIATALIGTVSAGAGAMVAYSRTLPDATKIAPGVRIADESVGGLTREEALEKARSWARQRLANAIVLNLTKPEKKWAITLGELGGRFDLETAVDTAWQIGKDDNFFERLYHGQKERSIALTPELKLDQAKFDAYLKRVAKAIHKPAQNARAKMDSKGHLVLVEREQKGTDLDIEATRNVLLNNGLAGLADGESAAAVIKEEEPTVSATDLGKMGTLLAAFSTDYGGSPSNRKANVALGASKINGTLLGPGQVFSYNDTVGPREVAFGWKMAHQYQDGLVVDGVGGGVCQLSSTLYNAVLQADLKIVSRSNHSMPVRYVSAGRDATVVYGAVDFKFQNSTDGPIFLGAKADGETLTFRIFGTKAPERKVLSIYSSERRYTPTGHFSVTSFRKVQLSDGTTKTEVIDNSSYRPPRDPSTAPKPRR